MIIGFDASRAFTNKKTGTENYSYQLLYNLSKIDHTNNYRIFIRPGIDKEQINNWPDNFKFVTIPLPKLWTQAGLSAETIFGSGIDMLFVPSHTLPLFRKPGLKTIVTVHDLGAEFLPQSHQIKQRLYLNVMTHHQLKTATHIIAVSEATKRDIIDKVGISDVKITVIYEGYNTKLFKGAKSAEPVNVLSKYNLTQGKYFLFVGTIQPRKNLANLITSYAMFLGKANKEQMSSDLPILVLAGSNGWLSEEIYRLPDKLNITDYVKFLGYVPDEDLPSLYTSARGFLFPSLFEGFGLPILEAFACGCPVLSSSVSSMPEVAGDAAILVNPNSKEEISDGIIKLYFDKDASKELTKKGFAQIRKFSWEKTAKETLGVFEKVTGLTSSP